MFHLAAEVSQMMAIRILDRLIAEDIPHGWKTVQNGGTRRRLSRTNRT